MKLKYKEIQEKTRDIQIFGSLINKWIFQRNELNEKRNIFFNKIYGENAENNIDENYPIIEINNNENNNDNNDNNTKKSYHKTFEEQLEFMKNVDIPNEEEEINTNKKQVYNNSDNIKQIFNQIQIEENKNENNINNKDMINNEIKNENKNENENEDEKNNDNKKEINNEEENKNKEIDINDIQINISNNENNKDNTDNQDNKDNINEEGINNKKEIIKKEKEEKTYKFDNKNKYLQNINLFPEKEIPEDTEALYKLTTLINSEEEENINIINNDIFLNGKNKNKQIPIQLIIKEFFHDVIIKQNTITNQTFTLMLKNKFGLMHFFDFFNSIILCNKGNIILQYIELIFDFKTLTLNTSDPDYLTNELRNLVKSEYENNIKNLYLNNLLESLKFSRLSDLNLNYAINNLELNFKLEYIAAPPIDVIFNSSNNDSYDKIFKKLLKYNIYNQIGVKIYQMLKNTRFNINKNNKNKKIKYSNFNDDDLDEDSNHDIENNNNILNMKLAKLFNKSFKIFKGILSYIYQQIIQKIWIDMEKKIESSMEVFQIIKYHYEALKNITNFFNNNLLIKYFENLCNDLAQLYLQIMVSDYYDKHQEKTDFLEEVIEKLKGDNKNIIKYRDSLDYISPYFPLISYL